MSGDDVFSVPNSISSASARVSSPQELGTIINPNPNPTSDANSSSKKRRNLPGTPDPDAEVIALSPRSLMTKNRFICEICNKGFQREQNLQLHRRGHNLPWKLKQRSNKDGIKKKVYICPETTCVHHDPGRALGDLTGVKKHFSRKHGEKKWKCEKCGKKYAVQSDWKAHSKICGTREYKCDCGTIFSRKDSFTTHRAFCDALAEERSRFTSIAAAPNSTFNFTNPNNNLINHSNLMSPHLNPLLKPRLPLWLDYNPAINPNQDHLMINPIVDHDHHSSNLFMPSTDHMQMAPNDDFCNATLSPAPPPLSATSLLQKAAEMGFARRRADHGEVSPGLIGSSGGGDGISRVIDHHHQSMVDQQCADDDDRVFQFGLQSLTRDFLGGGGARPFLPQGTAGFASMRHFSANDH